MLLLVLPLISDCSHCPIRNSTATPSPAFEPPAAPREFRAAWVAVVSNIDWPSKPGLSTAQQQEEMLAYVDLAANLRLNAIVLQVRPACDAFYTSGIEPWSEYLTGRQGQAPEPAYDPLAEWIAAAHRRGIELHAWFNPFRARATGTKSPLASNHIARTRPDMVRSYGEYLWLDPGESEAREYSLRVMLDVVRRYDIDGVHIDDYFYPYPQKDQDFPDNTSWQKYVRGGGLLDRADWRRQNINTFVQALYAGVKAEKRFVKVGISPFGIWRPGNPPPVRGFDAYSIIYADSRLWLHEGWCDYFTPQLYWKHDASQQPFDGLLQWWLGENTQGRYLWPGMYTSRVADPKYNWPADEILAQINTTRARMPLPGHVHFSARALLHNNGGVAEALRTSTYSDVAAVPAFPWLDATVPVPPTFSLCERRGIWTLSWDAATENVRFWCVYTHVREAWDMKLLPAEQRELALPAGVSAVAISALSRTGIESPRRGCAVPPAP
ncbi:MAG: glycoside hydrolase family 10 protein [Tepidisphaerales bacterium]